jgi:hypothetical protein
MTFLYSGFLTLTWSILLFESVDESAIKRFVTEAPIGWQRLAKSYDSKKFTIEFESMESPDSASHVGKKVIWQMDGNVRIDADIFDRGQAIRYTQLHNSDYEALLSKRNDGTWSISKCQPAAPLGYERFPSALPSLCAARDYHLPSFIDGVGQVDRRHEVAFILDDAWTSTDLNGEELVTASFLFGTRNENSEFAVNGEFSRGFVFRVQFLPSRNWCVKTVEFVYPAIGQNIRTEAKFSVEGSHPFELLTFEGKVGDKELKPRLRERFSVLESTSMSEDQFRLSAFGLVEPDEFLLPRGRLNWGLIGTLILVGIGVLFFAIRSVGKLKICQSR